MFDVTSWVRETIFRRPKLTPSLAGEELSEKQTTKMGYFLLYCMFFAILGTAQWTLAIIKDIPQRPTPVPSCVSDILRVFDASNTNYTYYSDTSYYGRNSCILSSENPRYNLTQEYNALSLAYNDLKMHLETLSRLNNEKSSANYRNKNNRENYNTSLSERTAGEQDPLYDSNQIRQDISNTRNTISSIDEQIASTEQTIREIKSLYAPQVSQLKQVHENAKNSYERAYLVYRMFIAILSLAFSGLVFAFLYKMYVRTKLENSPHTIIFSVATFAYGIILLQVLLLFLWDIIPHRFLEWLLGWISLFTPLLFLVQFLWPVIIIAVFGFLVYRIQKRLYSAQNIIKRFVTDKKCPNCGNAVDMTKPFCPLCSHEIHIHCPKCHELTMKGMPFCSNCGSKLPTESEVYHSDAHTLSDEIKSELEKIDISQYSAVEFHLLDGSSFNSKRETIIRLASYITNRIGKTTFAPNEFAPYLEKILTQVDRKGISQAELDRVLGKIKTWVEIGGTVNFINK